MPIPAYLLTLTQLSKLLLLSSASPPIPTSLPLALLMCPSESALPLHHLELGFWTLKQRTHVMVPEIRAKFCVVQLTHYLLWLFMEI